MMQRSNIERGPEEIIMLERAALDRWGNDDPSGFLELYADEISYFDPTVAGRIDGHHAMENYYLPWIGKIQIARYEMLNPQVVVDGNMALLTYNLVNYIVDGNGGRICGCSMEFHDRFSESG